MHAGLQALAESGASPSRMASLLVRAKELFAQRGMMVCAPPPDREKNH